MEKKTLFILSLMVIGLLMASLSFSKIDPDDVQDGHVYLFEDVNENSVEDSTENNLTGTINGDPQPVKGIIGQALEFNGSSDSILIPDSRFINVTNGPWPNRTVMAVFNCADVSKGQKQTIFEEGGRTRGIVLYVFDGEVYVGAWNRAEYNWNGAWLSAPIKSNRWYEVAAIIRDAAEKVEDDKFEMWLDGRLIDKVDGGQIHNHSNDNAIGATIQNTVFHDEDGSGDGFYFEGMIDEVWILNSALTASDLGAIRSVEPINKLAYTWGKIKVQQ